MKTRSLCRQLQMVALAAALVTMWAVPASADDGPLRANRDGGLRAQVPIQPPGQAGDPAPVAGPVGDAPPTVTVRTFRALDDGTYCEGRAR